MNGVVRALPPDASTSIAGSDALSRHGSAIYAAPSRYLGRVIAGCVCTWRPVFSPSSILFARRGFAKRWLVARRVLGNITVVEAQPRARLGCHLQRKGLRLDWL